jgi:hypothetical protein
MMAHDASPNNLLLSHVNTVFKIKKKITATELGCAARGGWPVRRPPALILCSPWLPALISPERRLPSSP